MQIGGVGNLAHERLWSRGGASLTRHCNVHAFWFGVPVDTTVSEVCEWPIESSQATYSNFTSVVAHFFSRRRRASSTILLWNSSKIMFFLSWVPQYTTTTEHVIVYNVTLSKNGQRSTAINPSARYTRGCTITMEIRSAKYSVKTLTVTVGREASHRGTTRSFIRYPRTCSLK